MHRYECGNCNLRSEPFPTRRGAEERGMRHRDEMHDGMHPDESIVSVGYTVPRGRELMPFLLVGLLVLVGLGSRLI